MAILVTGGAGYIGSHTVVKLLEEGEKVLILDNFSNSSEEVVNRLERISGLRPAVINGDVRDGLLLRDIFKKSDIQSVIHFAGLKSVSDSEQDPLQYYDNNVAGTITLLREMKAASVKQIVFSSSATVYGEPLFLPYTESHSVKPINVYGQTKLMVEQILQDLAQSDGTWRVALLRYFNPVGAHSSGLIGEDPTGTPNNLMPFLTQVAIGKRECLSIFGDNYPTEDGTGKRDYIHVDDLAAGHLSALSYLQKNPGVLITNLGTGNSTSVLELIAAFEKASGKKIPYKVVAPRAGDLPEYYADPSLAKSILGWVAKQSIDSMCADSWRWQSLNPNGYS